MTPAAPTRLRALELFDGAPDALADAVDERLAVVRWRRGEDPPAALARDRHIYLVRAGHLAMLAPISAGERQVMTGLLSVGDVYTSPDALNGPCGIPIGGDVLVSPIADALLERLLARAPRLGVDLTRLLTYRIHMLRESVALVSHFRVEDRLWGRISQLAERFGVMTPRGVELRLDLTHRQWALLVGASREATTSAFGRLRSAGRLQADGRTIVLPHE